MASNKTALNHGIIFRDPISGDMSITFETKSQKAGNREILISGDDNRVPSSGEAHGILMEFLTEEGGNRGTDPSDRFPVFLGGFFMWRGVKIEEKDLQLLRLALKRSKLDPDFKKQFEKALDHYKSDGRRWDFDSNELKSPPASESSDPVKSGGEEEHHHLNVIKEEIDESDLVDVKKTEESAM